MNISDFDTEDIYVTGGILEQKYLDIMHECTAGTFCNLGDVLVEIFVTPKGKFVVTSYKGKVTHIQQCDFMEHEHVELHENIVEDFNKKERL